VRPASARAQIQRNLRIVIAPIIVSSDAPKEQHLLADIMGDILAWNLSKTLWEETGSDVRIEQMEGLSLENENDLEMAIRFLIGKDFSHLIWGELSSSSPLGYALRTRIIDLKMATRVGPNRASKSLSAIMSGRSDFDEIEAKIADLSLGLTRVLATGETDTKEKRVFFWCVSPADPDNRSLATVSRRIALEMPYYLALHWEKEFPDNHLASLNPKDYYYHCGKLKGDISRQQKGDLLAAPGYMDFDMYDYIITAETIPAKSDTVEIYFLVVERRAGRYINIPIPKLSIPVNFERDTLINLSIKFSDAFENAIRHRY
jgi:hypothetical protein